MKNLVLTPGPLSNGLGVVTNNSLSRSFGTEARLNPEVVYQDNVKAVQHAVLVIVDCLQSSGPKIHNENQKALYSKIISACRLQQNIIQRGVVEAFGAPWKGPCSEKVAR
eukprot:gb/GECG01011853.1/.p1 GENE.gb/GECG01011853.1/~~gb/GECG01011853.1/.p1  ORF type:complete len:110 (+),score=10.43 gb/GECG01011853.1/:1-330(+)